MECGELVRGVLVGAGFSRPVPPGGRVLIQRHVLRAYSTRRQRLYKIIGLFPQRKVAPIVKNI